MKNKKALSGVVTTTLLILISIAAVAILAVAIRSVIKEPFLSPNNNCLNSNLNPQLSIKSVCYNNNTKDIEITIRRAVQDNPVQILSFMLNNEKWQCSDSCGDCIIQNQADTKTYYLESNSNPVNSQISIAADNCMIETREIKDLCE